MPTMDGTASRPRFRVTIDFGGVLVRPKWNTVGEEMPGALDFLRWLEANGFGRVLWTFREGPALEAALDWLAERGFPREWWDAVNVNPPDIIEKYQTDSRKLYTDVLLDDRAAGFPLKLDAQGAVIPDWNRIKKELLIRRELGGKVFDDPTAATPLARLRPGLLPPTLAKRAGKAVTLSAPAGATPGSAGTPATLTDAIAETAMGPKSVTVDGQTVQAHDIKELIEADRYLASKKAARRPGLQFTKLVSPGAE